MRGAGLLRRAQPKRLWRMLGESALSAMLWEHHETAHKDAGAQYPVSRAKTKVGETLVREERMDMCWNYLL